MAFWGGPFGGPGGQRASRADQAINLTRNRGTGQRIGGRRGTGRVGGVTLVLRVAEFVNSQDGRRYCAYCLAEGMRLPSGRVRILQQAMNGLADSRAFWVERDECDRCHHTERRTIRALWVGGPW
jgi:hypothetical protein